MSPPNVTLALQQLDQEIAFSCEHRWIGRRRDAESGGTVSFVEAAGQRFIPTPFQTMDSRSSYGVLALLLCVTADARGYRMPQPTSFRTCGTSTTRCSAPTTRIVVGAHRSCSRRAVSPCRLPRTPIRSRSSYWWTSFRPQEPTCFRRSFRTTSAVQSFGMRTMGAGGSVVGFNATAYTESFFRVTVSLMNRGHLVKAPGLPAAPASKTSACAPTWSRTL